MGTPPISTKPDQTTEAPDNETRNAMIAIGVVVLLVVLGLIAGAVVLAINADSASPGVEIIRDLLIVFMTLELIVIGVALVLLLVQLARFVNLINNEVQPVLESAQETLQTVKGTAQFLSKYLADPVMDANSALRGLNAILGDVDVIRKAAGGLTSAVVLDSAEPADDNKAQPAGDTKQEEPEATKNEPSVREFIYSSEPKQEED